MSTNTNANFPSAKPDWMPMEWWAFFLALFNRTGGPGSPIDILTLQKQDEISQDVPPQNAATIAALQGVNDLWAEQRAPENLADIRNRISDLEALIGLPQALTAVLRRADDIESMLADFRLPVAPVLEQWNAPTLTNSWVNFGSSYNPPGYWKDPFGVVHLRGMIKSGTIGLAAFTLPVGYRPANQEAISAIANDAAARLEISNAGAVIPTTGSNLWFSLDGATFRAA